jgi:O-succinylbenzoic acid--CoA ligase
MYLTFGMTETVSHFAIRKLNGIDRSEYYKALKGIVISTDDRGCLTVAGSITNNKTIFTNDLVEIIGHDKFKWLGRIDHVINSGGIKINIDLLERKIKEIFSSAKISNDFYLEGIKDRKYGSKLILVFEIGNSDRSVLKKIKLLLDQLTKYDVPKEIRTIRNLVVTKTGKIDRTKSLAISTSEVNFLSNE